MRNMHPLFLTTSAQRFLHVIKHIYVDACLCFVKVKWFNRGFNCLSSKLPDACMFMHGFYAYATCTTYYNNFSPFCIISFSSIYRNCIDIAV